MINHSNDLQITFHSQGIKFKLAFKESDTILKVKEAIVSDVNSVRLFLLDGRELKDDAKTLLDMKVVNGSCIDFVCVVQ